MRLRFSRHRAAPTGWNVSVFMDPGVRGFDCFAHARTQALACGKQRYSGSFNSLTRKSEPRFVGTNKNAQSEKGVTRGALT